MYMTMIHMCVIIHSVWHVGKDHHSHVCGIIHMCVTCLSHMFTTYVCEIIHMYVTSCTSVWHHSYSCDIIYICVTLFTCVWHVAALCSWRMCVTSFTCTSHVCHIIHVYMWHHPYVCDVMRMCVTIFTCVWHEWRQAPSFTCVWHVSVICAWLIYMWDVTRWYVLGCSHRREAMGHCSTLQHTATHCNTLQHTATHYNTPQHTAKHTAIWREVGWEAKVTTMTWWPSHTCDVTIAYSHNLFTCETWLVHISSAISRGAGSVGGQGACRCGQSHVVGRCPSDARLLYHRCTCMCDRVCVREMSEINGDEWHESECVCVSVCVRERETISLSFLSLLSQMSEMISITNSISHMDITKTMSHIRMRWVRWMRRIRWVRWVRVCLREKEREVVSCIPAQAGILYHRCMCMCGRVWVGGREREREMVSAAALLMLGCSIIDVCVCVRGCVKWESCMHVRYREFVRRCLPLHCWCWATAS